MTWDAWNRLVSVSDGTTPAASYAYDGLSRRTTTVTGGTTRRYYYTPQWQIVEERLGTATTAERQFVWGLWALDDLLLRDYGAQRMCGMHDYFNCTAIVDTTGTVRERYGHSAFGQPIFMTAAFGSLTASAYGWETLFANYRLDGETGFYQVRYRYLHSGLGRWLSRDPLYEPGFELRKQSAPRTDKINLCLYASNDPIRSELPISRTLVLTTIL
jgi:RHS repeat-associated protein